MKQYFLLIFLLVWIIGGCSTADNLETGTLAAWIDAPLHESTIPLAPYQIIAHGSDQDKIQMIEILINGELLDRIPAADAGNQLQTFHADWIPPAPGDYLIEVRAKNGNEEWSETARAQVTVEDVKLPTAADLTLIPTENPAEAITICSPEITALMNTTCRQGPSPYNIPIAYLIEGDIALIKGQNQDASWWVVLLDTEADACWVAGQTVQANCLNDTIEVLDSPPYITRVFPSQPEIYWGDYHIKKVSIQAESSGEIPVTNVRLIYHLAGKPQWYNINMAPLEAGIWQATIQAQSFDGYRNIDSAVIEYYLEAVNQKGLMTKTPIFNNIKLKEVP